MPPPPLPQSNSGQEDNQFSSESAVHGIPLSAPNNAPVIFGPEPLEDFFNTNLLEPLHGSLKNIDPTTLKVKYEEEVRLCLGVFLYQHPCGKIEGRRIDPFSYTCQTVITETEWCRKVSYEIERVKSLTGDKHGNKGPWTGKIR